MTISMDRVFFFFFYDIFLAQRLGSAEWRRVEKTGGRISSGYRVSAIELATGHILSRHHDGVEIYTKIQWPSVRSVSHAHASSSSYGRAR